MGGHDQLWGHEPWWFVKREITLHKERKPWGSTTMMTLVVFTQVRAAVKNKTLLLLLVDWMREHDEHAALKPDKVVSRRAATRVQVCDGPNPLLGCLGPPFIA